MHDRETHLCFAVVGPTRSDRCLEALREVDEVIDQRVWKCGAGHIWYGNNPNVLKSEPWKKPTLRYRLLKRLLKIQSPSRIARGDE